MAAAHTVAASPLATPVAGARFSLSDDVASDLQNRGTRETAAANLKYLVVGVAFGIVFVKAEIVSWFRIHEMFRFDAFHMYGVIGTAVAVGATSVWLIRRFDLRSLAGERIVIADKRFGWGQVYGGLLFGLGWAFTGACPGPLFAHIGAGYGAVVVTLLAALAGTWTCGALRDRLPG